MINIENTEENMQLLLNCCGEVGRTLLANGAETFRIEDTIERVAKCYIDCEAEVFATTTSIFMSINVDGNTYSKIIRHRRPSTKLNKVDEVNTFSRKLAINQPPLKTSMDRILKIQNSKDWSYLFRGFASGVTSSFFSLMFGGDFLDFLAAFIIGFISFVLLERPLKIELPVFIYNLIAGLISSILAGILFNLGLGSNVDMIIIGAIMPYVPGISITNSIRDLFMGEFVSGTMLFVQAVATAIAIALGAVLGLQLF